MPRNESIAEVVPTEASCRTVEELEDWLSRPSESLIESLAKLAGDLMILGVGGKMGPTLARMAQRASDAAGARRRIIGVSRFHDNSLRDRLHSWNVETISCDLLNESEVAKLPDVPLIVAMTGMKFGTNSNPSLSWAMNCYLPAIVCKRFRNSRIVAFSSGNVYGLVPVTGTGSRESDPLRPVGEYAITVLGRERMYEYFSRELQIPMAFLRLNYSTELRYGVLFDLATTVWNQHPVGIDMGFVNVIWQRDANDMSLRALTHVNTPPKIINIAGNELVRVRDIAERLGRILERPVTFAGREATDALLNDARGSYPLVGEPLVPISQMLKWTADWVRQGGQSLGKPTHFESRDGTF